MPFGVDEMHCFDNVLRYPHPRIFGMKVLEFFIQAAIALLHHNISKGVFRVKVTLNYFYNEV